MTKTRSVIKMRFVGDQQLYRDFGRAPILCNVVIHRSTAATVPAGTTLLAFNEEFLVPCFAVKMLKLVFVCFIETSAPVPIRVVLVQIYRADLEVVTMWVVDLWRQGG